jgi:hypothetical protein
VLLGCVLFVFAWSTFAKLVWPSDTVAVLRQVWGVPSSLAPVVFGTLIAAEFGLLMMGLLLPRAAVTHFCLIAFIAAVSVSPIRQLLSGSSLSCGCGKLTLGMTPPFEQGLALTRNGLLILVIVYHVLLHRQDDPRA